MNIKEKNICVIGMGKAGSVLAIELSGAGAKIKYLIGKEKKILKAISRKIKNSVIKTKIDNDAISNSDIIIIAVKDNEIKKVSQEVYKLALNFKNKVIFHISGSLISNEISNSKIPKKNIASFHPIQTFNKISVKNSHLLSGIYFGVEGGKLAVKCAAEIVKLLGSKYIVIPASKKYIYHIAAVFASNYLVVISDIIDELSKFAVNKKEINSKIFLPIMKNTLSNIERSGTTGSLTGPVERNDVHLLENHIKELKNKKRHLLPIYSMLGKAASEIAMKKGSINKKEITKLNNLFDRSLPSLKTK